MDEYKRGKNFSCNNTGKRKKSDFYETPYSITKQFLEREKINKGWSILEPAVGNGAISKIIKKYYNNITVYSYEKGLNFLSTTKHYDFVITNPPFSLAFEFIQKAKQIANQKIAFLLPLAYLHGKKRFDNIYSDKIFPLSHIYVFTRYPLLGKPLREDGKYKTGMMVYAWYVWDKNPIYKEPIIKWIDNNEYVIGARSYSKES